MAAQRSATTGALIRIDSDAGAHLLAVTPTATDATSPRDTIRWRVHSAPQRIAELIRASDLASARGGEEEMDHRAAWALHAPAIARALRSWRRHVRLHASMTNSASDPTAMHGHRTNGATRVRRRISQLCAQLTPVERQQHGEALRQARDCLQRARGAAAELALADWSAKARTHPDGAWLTAWRSYPALAALPPDAPPPAAMRRSRWRIRAVLLLVTD